MKNKIISEKIGKIKNKKMNKIMKMRGKLKIKVQMKAKVKVMIIVYGKKHLNSEILHRKSKDKDKNSQKQEDEQEQKQNGDEQTNKDFDEREEFEENRKEKREKFKSRREKTEKDIRGTEGTIKLENIGKSKEEIDWKVLLRREVEKTETIWSQRRSIAENNYAYRLEGNDIEDEAESEVMIDVSGSVDLRLVKSF